MEKEVFLDLLKKHLVEMYQEYIDKYKCSKNISFRYMCLGRANSYMEVMGFILGASVVERLHKEMLDYESK